MQLGADVVRFAEFLEREVWPLYIEEGDYFAIQYEYSRYSGPVAWQLGIAGSHDELIKLILDWVQLMEAEGGRNYDRAMVAFRVGSLIQVHA